MAPIATGPSAEQNDGSKEEFSIPLISFETLFDPSTPEAVKKETALSLLSAFTDYGFLYLTSYSSIIPPDLLSRVFDQSAHFFALPLDVKDSVAWTTARANRGYTGMGREKTSEGMTQEEVEKQRLAEGGDLKESLEIGREAEEGYPNRWYADDETLGATGSAEFKSLMIDFFDRCKQIHQLLMQGIAVALGIDEGFFDGFTRLGDNTLRLLHYPPVPAGGFDGGKKVRAGAHTDYGSVTLLFQDSRGGLQIDPPASAKNTGKWIDVEPREGTIVVNAGDLLSRWSNDLIRSTKHRVVEPPLSRSSAATGQESGYPARYSIAYFCNPDFDGWIEAIPGTWGGEKGERKYEGVNSGDYLEQRLSATY